jgi:hypothetical protein
MNYKKKKYKYKKSSDLTKKKLSHWSYGHAIAKECLFYNEFKKDILIHG